jgi:uncharacterized protein YkwD
MLRRPLSGILLVALCLAAEKEPAPGSAFTADEKTVLELTNKSRAEQKLPPLTINALLTDAARRHSENMAIKGEMKHILDGKNPAQRIKEAGYKYTYAGENIAMGENTPVPQIFEAWMKSQGHRANILNSDYREIGIGIARDDKGRIYYTQAFGSRR